MDFKQGLDFRYHRYSKEDKLGFNKYNYGANGILYKVLPKILFKGNPNIVGFLQMIDLRLIMMFKTIERIRRFKHITAY